MDGLWWKEQIEMDELGVPQYGNPHSMQPRLKSMKLIEHCLVFLVFEHEWGVFEPVPAFVVISSIWSNDWSPMD